MSVSSDEVLFEVKDSKGLIKLNRPKVLNSLNLNMIRLIYSKLCQWDSDPNIKMMIIRSTSEKAFCAGGDVRGQFFLFSRPPPPRLCIIYLFVSLTVSVSIF